MEVVFLLRSARTKPGFNLDFHQAFRNSQSDADGGVGRSGESDPLLQNGTDCRDMIRLGEEHPDPHHIMQSGLGLVQGFFDSIQGLFCWMDIIRDWF